MFWWSPQILSMKPRTSHGRGILAKVLAVLAALLVWQIGAMWLGQRVLLVSPLSVAGRLCTIWREPGFFAAIWFSFSRIARGFFAGFALGILLATLAGRFPILETVFLPYLLTVKSVPVASFIVIALLWLSSAELSIFISFLMVLPIVYNNVLAGIRNVDPKMVEMAQVFHLSFGKRLLYIWLSQVKPYLLSACATSIGLAWKSGIAAEIIGIPDGSMGEMLYEAKVYLNTRDLFAWTVVIVAVSVLFEKAFIWMLKRLFSVWETHGGAV